MSSDGAIFSIGADSWLLSRHSCGDILWLPLLPIIVVVLLSIVRLVLEVCYPFFSVWLTDWM